MRSVGHRFNPRSRNPIHFPYRGDLIRQQNITINNSAIRVGRENINMINVGKENNNELLS